MKYISNFKSYYKPYNYILYIQGSTCTCTCMLPRNFQFPIIIAYFCSQSVAVQEVYDDTATVSRKHEVIQTVMNDVKTHQATNQPS